MLPQSSTCILVPIEVPLRECYPKAILASKLAAEGHTVVIGGDYVISKLSIYGATYLSKNHIHYSKIVSQSSFLAPFIFLDDEGAPIIGDMDQVDAQIAARLWAGAEKHADVILTWGDYQKKIFKKYTKKPIHITGHPALEVAKDVYRGAFESIDSIITMGLKDYILINTRYGSINTRFPLRDVNNNNDYFFNEKLNEAAYRQIISNEMISLGHLIELVQKLSAKFSQKNIIVRPHPAESIDFYLNLFADLHNVRVIREGHVIPWLRRAAVVVMNGCTTSVQAINTQTPIVNFQPENSDQQISYLDTIGNKAVSEAQVITFVEQAYGPKRRDLIIPWTDPLNFYNLHQNALEEITKYVNERCISVDDHKRKNIIGKYFFIRENLRRYVKKFMAKPIEKEYLRIPEYIKCCSILFNTQINCIKIFDDLYILKRR